MSRLPIPGSDDNTWGQILNDYLSIAHNADGTLKTSALSSTGAELVTNKNQPSGYLGLDSTASVARTALDSSTRISLTKADNAPTSLAAQSDVSVIGVSNNQVLSYSTGSSKWIPATVSSTTVGDATTSSKGILQLSGDLSGTAIAPMVANGAITGTKIASTTITDANISATAAIAKSKLAAFNVSDSDITAGGLSPTKITGTAVITTDSRLSDARTPTAHHTTHQTGGSDALSGTLDANARTGVAKNSGATTGTRRKLNFIEGSNISLAVTDDIVGEKVDVTITSSGGVPSNRLISTGSGLLGGGDLSADRTLTIDTSVVATLTGIQTLTNKTLISPAITTPTGITKTDVGLGNVDNTSDANKPISTATQTAINAKAADAAVVHNTGNESISGVKTFSTEIIVPTPSSASDATTKAYVDAGRLDQAHELVVSSSGASFSIDVSLYSVFTITLTADCTFTLTNISATLATTVTLILIQDGTGSRIPTISPTPLWSYGTPPTFTVTPAGIDVVSLLISNGGTVVSGFLAGVAMA